MELSFRERVIWLAAVLEGEGWFGLHRPTKWPCLRIAVQMTDQDVIDRIANIFGPGIYRNHQPRLRLWFDPRPGGRANGGSRKPLWGTSVTGPDAVGWMMMVYPFMGQRRRTQIRRSLDIWRKAPINAKYVRMSLIRRGVMPETGAMGNWLDMARRSHG